MTAEPSEPAEPVGLADRLATALERIADPRRAGPMAAYMRDQFTFLGVTTPRRRAAVRQVLASGPTPLSGDVLDLAAELWCREPRELQYAAIDVLARHALALDGTALEPVGRLITTKSWWDTVDALASKVCGPIVRRHPASAVAMDRWIADDDRWLVRAALLHQLTWKADTDTDRLFDYCARQAGHRDVFVRKAIGWALRDYARTDPSAVAAFVADHPELSPLSRREALKHLSGR